MEDSKYEASKQMLDKLQEKKGNDYVNIVILLAIAKTCVLRLYAIGAKDEGDNAAHKLAAVISKKVAIEAMNEKETLELLANVDDVIDTLLGDATNCEEDAVAAMEAMQAIRKAAQR